MSNLKNRDRETRFQNVKAGEPFSTRGALGADYSLQFAQGFKNYTTWSSTYDEQHKEKGKSKTTLFATPIRRVVFRPREDAEGDADTLQRFMDNITVEEEPRRTGPTFVRG
ncbi:hypothetical protein FRC00_007424 [Tulasnella sp. 408]|nr:hypothetical protein FRC00_007424 [Tulasnella sp. 408]